VRVLGVSVARLSLEEAETTVARLCRENRPSLVFYMNAHSVNLARTDERFRTALDRADVLLNDGVGLALAGRLHRRRFPVNLNGSDFTPRVLRILALRERRVYFLGGKPGVAERAVEQLRDAIPGLRVAGCHHGYFADAEDRWVADRFALPAPTRFSRRWGVRARRSGWRPTSIAREQAWVSASGRS
jgi:UDP-N-acetyl-D-mannosaminuronic acid transferase (WecB/TagA/CpsF family)